MPLPLGGQTPWPPEDCHGHLKEVRAHAAWWSGDVTELMLTSDTEGDGNPLPAQERRFNMGPMFRRRFWQRRADTRDATSSVRAVHAPLGGDIAATSADLLFGEPPDLTIEEPAVPKPKLMGPEPDPFADPEGHQARSAEQAVIDADHEAKVDAQRQATAARQSDLEELVTKVQLWSRLLEGAETCAATGGVYLRCAWDTDLADHPLLNVIDQSHAVPDFKWGVLRAVTFWEEVHRENQTVWRHLERHEDGVILHGLYIGTAQLLGDATDLSAHPSTAGLEPMIPLPEGCPRPLIVEYVPNVLPNRRHRNKPIGRSDYAGQETFLDSLDEVWSSWMRDIRLGQARIVVPDEFLQPAGFKPGEGKTLDLDRELFTGLEVAELEKLNDPIKLIQPDLRHESHAETVLRLVRDIVSAAGYSPQTYGIDIDGQAESGTALRVREKKTLATVKRKRGYWTPGVENTVENLSALNAALFGGSKPERPRVDWPDLTDDPVERANTTGVWHTAQAVSLEERVRARNPHWDEEQIQEEVERIKDEKAAATPMLDLPLPEDEDVQPGKMGDQNALFRRKPPEQPTGVPGKPAGK